MISFAHHHKPAGAVLPREEAAFTGFLRVYNTEGVTGVQILSDIFVSIVREHRSFRLLFLNRRSRFLRLCNARPLLFWSPSRGEKKKTRMFRFREPEPQKKRKRKHRIQPRFIVLINTAHINGRANAVKHKNHK